MSGAEIRFMIASALASAGLAAGIGKPRATGTPLSFTHVGEIVSDGVRFSRHVFSLITKSIRLQA